MAHGHVLHFAARNFDGHHLANARFSLGFYASRIFALIATIFVLLVLLSETTILYANLARSMMRQRGERNARQTAMDAMAASIVHEINQPLAAKVVNGQAALALSCTDAGQIDQVRAALKASSRTVPVEAK